MRQPLPKNQSVNLGSSETQVYFKWKLISRIARTNQESLGGTERHHLFLLGCRTFVMALRRSLASPKDQHLKHSKNLSTSTKRSL